MNLIRSALHAFKWSVFAEITSKVVGAVVLLFLARLLVPEDFGVVAAATVVISLSQIFVDAGLEKALIQRQTDLDESANVVFWLNLAFALFVGCALFAGATFIAGFFHDSRVEAVVRVLSIQLPITALGTVQAALLKKQLEFQRLFWVRLFTSTAGALTSIPCALLGMGYWALVFGTLLGQTAQTTVLWIGSHWKPKLNIDPALVRAMLRFGKWATLSGALGWFYGWMDSVIVGHYLGALELGLYRTGNTLVQMGFGVMFYPLLPVLYSTFSLSQNDLPRLKAGFQFVVRAIAIVSLPAAAFLFSMGPQIEVIFFGSDWTGIGRVIAILGLMHGISWIVGANGEIYRAIGRPEVETWTTSGMLIVYLAGYLVFVQYGLESFLLARLSLALMSLCVHIFVAWKVLHFPVRAWFPFGPVLSSGLAAAVTITMADTVTTPMSLILSIGIFGLVTLAGISFFERRFLRTLLDKLHQGGVS